MTKQSKKQGQKKGNYPGGRARLIVASNKDVVPQNDPFEIMEDLELTTGPSSSLVQALLDKIVKLEAGNTRQSINIPINLFPTRVHAQNLFNAVKRLADQSSDASINNMHFTLRTVLSLDKKTYLGSRIFRKF